MENKGYRLLLLGNFKSVYVVQLVKHLKSINPDAHISFWGYTREECEEDRIFLESLDDYCLFDIKHIVNKSTLWQIKAITRLRKSFHSFISERNFDYISIQYIKPEYFFFIDYIKKFSHNLVLTPWGSDVYCVSNFNKLLVKKIYEKADYITGIDNRFTQDFVRLFNVPTSKIVPCELGIDPIDYIISHKNLIDCNEAKRQLGIGNNYTITCGYNAASTHRHIEIIEAINKVRNQLPANLLLLFPLTYHKDEEYINTIKQKVNEYGLKAQYFEKFLDIPQLYLLRQSTDLFIHIQPSDASSGTLDEYILCEKKILNGGWLKYPEYEKDGYKPYYTVDNMDQLGEAIVRAVEAKPITIDKHILANLEKKQWKVVIKGWNKFFVDHCASK